MGERRHEANNTQAPTSAVSQQTGVAESLLVSLCVRTIEMNVSITDNSSLCLTLSHYRDVHHVCSWDDRGNAKLFDALRELILSFINECQLRVLGHQDDAALLRSYINEWVKFFAQCQYLPKPYMTLSTQNDNKGGQGGSHLAMGSTQEKPKDGTLVEKLMLDSWNDSIFSAIKGRLQDSAMKLVHSERSGEAFDTQLVIGVRESYGQLDVV